MINLLPPDVKKSIRFARLNVTLFQYCVLVLLTGASLSAMFFLGTRLLSSSKSDLESSIQANQLRVSELELINSEAKQLANDINTINILLQQEIKFSDLVIEIGAIMPPGASLSNLNLTKDKQAPLSLEVITESPDTVGVVQENIAESELFRGAEILNVTASNSKNTASGQIFTGSLNAYFDVPPPPAPVVEEESGASDE